MPKLEVDFLNQNDWREVSQGGYAQGYFKGWQVRPAPIVLEDGIVVGYRRLQGTDWVQVINSKGEFRNVEWVGNPNDLIPFKK